MTILKGRGCLATKINIQRMIHKFSQQILILLGKIKKEKLTTQGCRMEFFTLISQVSSRSGYSDARMGQARKVS